MRKGKTHPLSAVLKRKLANKALMSLSKEGTGEGRNACVNKDLAAIPWVFKVIKHPLPHCWVWGLLNRSSQCWLKVWADLLRRLYHHTPGKTPHFDASKECVLTLLNKSFRIWITDRFMWHVFLGVDFPNVTQDTNINLRSSQWSHINPVVCSHVHSHLPFIHKKALLHVWSHQRTEKYCTNADISKSFIFTLIV